MFRKFTNLLLLLAFIGLPEFNIGVKGYTLVASGAASSSSFFTPPERLPQESQSGGTISEELMPILSDFHCPILAEPFEDPVSTVDGHTYERAVITRWFQQQTGGQINYGYPLNYRTRVPVFLPLTSPVTNLHLPDPTLTPNHALRKAIEAFKELRQGLVEIFQRDNEEIVALRTRVEELEEKLAAASVQYQVALEVQGLVSNRNYALSMGPRCKLVGEKHFLSDGNIATPEALSTTVMQVSTNGEIVMKHKLDGEVAFYTVKTERSAGPGGNLNHGIHDNESIFQWGIDPLVAASIRTHSNGDSFTYTGARLYTNEIRDIIDNNSQLEVLNNINSGVVLDNDSMTFPGSTFVSISLPENTALEVGQRVYLKHNGNEYEISGRDLVGYRFYGQDTVCLKFQYKLSTISEMRLHEYSTYGELSSLDFLIEDFMLMDTGDTRIPNL